LCPSACPAYFSQPYKLERIIYVGNEPNEAFRERVSRSIEETKKLLDEQIKSEDLCPVTGPHGISVVLVDTSDDLLPTTQKEVRTLLNDLINDLPSYYKFDVRVLDIANTRSCSLFSKLIRVMALA
jgi:hypothetical protein